MVKSTSDQVQDPAVHLSVCPCHRAKTARFRPTVRLLWTTNRKSRARSRTRRSLWAYDQRMWPKRPWPLKIYVV